MPKHKYTTETFIEKARGIHGDKYDYSKVRYINNSTNVCIICPTHGEFWQTPAKHLSGSGCPKCVGRHHEPNYWTVERAIEESKKYKTLAEFKEKNQTACNFLYRSGDIDKCTWLERQFRYTIENCTEIAKKYKTEAEFNKECPRGYQFAKENNLFETFYWMKKTTETSSNLYWTYEKVLDEIKKYKTRYEFWKNCPGGYYAIKSHGWNDLLNLLPTSVLETNLYCVYAYEFTDNYAYIGLTYRPEERDLEHNGFGRYSKNKFKSPVYKHAFESNLEIPKPIYLYNNLTPLEAQKKECETIDMYKLNGWNVLNSVKGGSFGCGIRKWTREKCIIEAQKYCNKTELLKFSPSCYDSIKRNKWEDIFDVYNKKERQLDINFK